MISVDSAFENGQRVPVVLPTEEFELTPKELEFEKMQVAFAEVFDYILPLKNNPRSWDAIKTRLAAACYVMGRTENLTLRELAKGIGCSHSAISQRVNEFSQHFGVPSGTGRFRKRASS